MPAVPVITAVAGVAGAAMGARGARSAANSQQRTVDQQAALGREQLNFGREQYQDWRQMFMPVLGDLRDMAYEEQRPDYAGIAADVGQAFDASQGMNRRQMERFGVQPTDGATNASETQYGIGRALAQVGASNTARMGARDQQFNRLAQIGNLSAGQQAQATNTMQGGFGAMQGALGNQANLFGAQANNYMQAAAAGANMAGFGLNQMQGMFGQSNSQRAGIPQINVIPGGG
jgi:hypothetical protein